MSDNVYLYAVFSRFIISRSGHPSKYEISLRFDLFFLWVIIES